MTQSLLSTFIPLAIPVPPMLEEALGYTGQSRWVAFFWIPGGDELMYADGTVSTDGSWHAWLTVTHHRRIAPPLTPYHFGNSEEEARHWLLLDRETLRERRQTPQDLQAAVARAMRREQQLVTALKDWLDAH